MALRGSACGILRTRKPCLLAAACGSSASDFQPTHAREEAPQRATAPAVPGPAGLVLCSADIRRSKGQPACAG
eukprot:6909248-Alexandrium_andersonii.AAC.1